MKAKLLKPSKSDSASKAAAEHAERVSKRAYEIWEACGCPPGGDAEHWLPAEREVKEISPPPLSAL